jgi:hypothetical protein
MLCFSFYVFQLEAARRERNQKEKENKAADSVQSSCRHFSRERNQKRKEGKLGWKTKGYPNTARYLSKLLHAMGECYKRWRKKRWEKEIKKRYPLCIGVFGYFHKEVKPGPHNLECVYVCICVCAISRCVFICVPMTKEQFNSKSEDQI